ncbi:LysR family transcriptional regulator [Alteromonas sp. NFXS44]|uniref:LysR family transcriptional regulator n=1 Tax=Alteromonas sp. NFXS44 TaxID=2818435 RepID=UPI0032DF61F2
MNIASKDFNLLYLFTVLYEERSLNKAALRMNLSQPAMSHKLNKLRGEFDDPLFIRTGRGFTPTPKAHQMAKQVCCVVKCLEEFYVNAEGDAIGQRDEAIHIYGTDLVDFLLLPRLLDKVQAEAPGVTIVMHNTSGRLPVQALEQGDCDIAIAGFFRDLPEHFYRQSLMVTPYRVVHDKALIPAGTPLNVQTYASKPHVVSTLTGNLNSDVDTALAEAGLTRRVVAGASGFMVLPRLVTGREVFLTCLKPIADYATATCQHLTSREPPVSLPDVKIEQVWHPRTHEDGLRKWIREQIKIILSEV